MSQCIMIMRSISTGKILYEINRTYNFVHIITKLFPTKISKTLGPRITGTARVN